MSSASTVTVIKSKSASLRREGGGNSYMLLVYLALHVLALGVFWTGLSVLDFCLGLVLVQLRGFCMSGGYHRLLAHRSFKTTRTFRFLLAAGACTALRGGPLWWVAHHRHHHLHSDTKVDVFTPEQGFWWTYFLWLVSGKYRYTDYDRVRDLRSAVELRWLNRLWLLPTVVLIGTLWLACGWHSVISVYALSTVVFLHTLAWIDVLNHLVGNQRYNTGDDSRNNLALAILCNGEGWHNNHHHYPASACYGFFWWEVDGTFSILQMLARVGLVWDLKTPPAAILTRDLLDASPARKITPGIEHACAGMDTCAEQEGEIACSGEVEQDEARMSQAGISG